MSVTKQILLSLVVLAVLGGGWFLYQRWEQVFPSEATVAGNDAPVGAGPAGRPGAAPGGRPGGRFAGRGGAPIVVPAAVEMDQTGSELRAIGNLSAARAVTIFPQVGGMVTAVAVEPGAEVAEGQLLVQLDNGDQEIAVESAELALETAKAAAERAQRLARSQNITQVALAAAEADQQKAEIALRSAQLALGRRQIVAPFAGIVGLIEVSIGDVVGQSTKITTVDDLSTLTASFVAPQSYAGRLQIGHAVEATAEGAPGRRIAGRVSAVDSRVDPATRTFNVQATLTDGLEGLKPGMSVAVVLEFAGEAHPSVPSLAVQWDRNGSYVWMLDGETVKRVDVSILARRSGMVVVAGELTTGDEVVVEGLQRLRDGATVARLGAESGARQRPEAAPAENAPQAVVPPGEQRQSANRRNG